MTNDDIIKRAAKIMKILDLAKTPGMDEVCLKLNCESNYSEIEITKSWFHAIEIAKVEGNVFDAFKVLVK